MLTHQTSKEPNRSEGARRVLQNKYFIAGVILLLVYTLAGFFLTPYLIRRNVPKAVEAQLGRVARIGKVRVNPFIFTLEVNQFRMYEQEGTPIAGFERLFVDFETSSLWHWAWTFRAVSLEKPKINLILEKDGTLNLAKLIPAAAEQETTPPAPEASAPPRMVFPNIKIVEGEIEITDRRQSTPATVSIRPLNLELEEISTLRERKGPYALTATTTDHETFRWTGHIALHPFKSSGRLSFSNIKLGTLWAFIRDSVNLAQPNGLLHFKTEYALDLSRPEPHLSLDGAGLRVDDLSLKLEGEDNSFFTLARAELRDAQLDLGTRKIEVGGVQIVNGRLNLGIEENGRLNLERIARKRPQGGSAEDPVLEKPEANRGAAEQKALWDIQVTGVETSEMAVDFEDRSRLPALKAGIDGIGVRLELAAQAGEDGAQVIVRRFNSEIKGIRMGAMGEGEPAIRIMTLTLEDGTFDTGQRNAHLARIGLDDGHLNLVRSTDGQLNLVTLLASLQNKTENRPVSDQADPARDFAFSIDRVELSRFATTLNDLTVKTDGPVLNLDNLQATLTPVDGRSPMGVDLALDIRQGGRITAQGTVHPRAPSIEARVDVSALDLGPMQFYIEPYLTLLLQSGTFSTKGTLQYGLPRAASRMTYEGGFKLEKFQVIEPSSSETFLGWESLKTSQLKLRFQPGSLEIGDLMLSRLVGKFVIYEDGSLNVVRVVKAPRVADKAANTAPAEPAQAPARDIFPVNVQTLRLEGGALFFADLSLTPQFATRIHDLNGSVNGVSSKRERRTQIKLDGRVDDYGSAKIGGEVSLSDPRSFTDIGMIFRNLEMTVMTPYSGRFAGRRIDSGKLSLDLEYKIENSRLLGNNKIVVDQLTLGENVDSPKAISLPLDLAIAILKDADGVIDIGLPVKGDLADPEFGFGQLIWKALKNLLTKIVTAPFRALGALFGDEEADLETIAFEPGRSDVPPPEKEKLHKLAGAMIQRPQLKLIVQGRYSPEADGLYLKDWRLRRQLAMALGIDLGPDEDPGPVAYSDPKTRKKLEAMFIERFGKPAMTELVASMAPPPQAPKAQPQPSAKQVDPGLISKALFARLVAGEPVDDSELQQLGEARTLAVVTELTTTTGLPLTRVSGKTSEALPSGDPVTAKLELGVMGKMP